MKRFVLVVVALAVALGFAAPASAKPYAFHGIESQVWISKDRTYLDVIPMRKNTPIGFYRVPAKSGERWFQVADVHGQPAFVNYWVTPGGAPMVPDTSMMVAAAGDIIGAGTGGLRYDSNGNLYVTLSGGSATLNLPFAGNADAQAGTAQGQAVGLMIWNGSSWDRVQGTGGAINVAVTSMPNITANPTGSTGLNSGVCFNSVSNNATCGTLNSQTGCTTGPVLPCYWDLSKSQGFNATLVGHRITGVAFHSGKSMLTLNVALMCIDNTTFNADATHPMVIADLTTGTSMGSEQSWPIGPPGGYLVKNGWVCELSGINANTTPLSTTALQNVTFYVI